MLRSLTLAFILLGTACATAAQEAPEDGPRRVVLTDGTVIVGIVIDADTDPIVVVTENGVEQRVPRDRVAEIRPLYDGRFTRLDPNRSRLFVAPTGRTLGRGNGRLSTLVYILPNLAYGVTDRVDLSGSAFLVFGEGGGGLLSGNVKVQPLRTDGLAAAIGATAALPVGVEDSGSVGGFVYGVGTLGSETRAFTGGVFGFYGFSFESADAVFADGAAVLAAYEHQLTSAFKLITENYLIVGGDATGGIVTAGVRFFGDRFAVDLYGVVGVADGEVGGFAPLANFSYNF